MSRLLLFSGFEAELDRCRLGQSLQNPPILCLSSPIKALREIPPVCTISDTDPVGRALTSLTGIGVAVLLANWTQGNRLNDRYSKAAADQLKYLLNNVPKSESGAISHRTDETQLWSVLGSQLLAVGQSSFTSMPGRTSCIWLPHLLHTMVHCRETQTGER